MASNQAAVGGGSSAQHRLPMVCGFELDDTIPNHSTFSKTRTRKWQSDLFQKAFYEMVKQCIDSGLIDGEAMATDGSYIPANVSRESWINVRNRS